MTKSSPVTDPLVAGREALSRGEWDEARAQFEHAVEQDGTAEAVEALAMAAWWLDDARVTIESREQAYRLYRERGDGASAARMAMSIPTPSSGMNRSPGARPQSIGSSALPGRVCSR